MTGRLFVGLGRAFSRVPGQEPRETESLRLMVRAICAAALKGPVLSPGCTKGTTRIDSGPLKPNLWHAATVQQNRSNVRPHAMPSMHCGGLPWLNLAPNRPGNA